MTTVQKYILWAAGILLWIFGLSILLSYVAFGYLDLLTVRHMALVFSPVLAVGAVLLYVFKQPSDSEQPQEAPVRGRMREATR